MKEIKTETRYYIGAEDNNYLNLYKGNTETKQGSLILLDEENPSWKKELLPFQVQEISKAKYERFRQAKQNPDENQIEMMEFLQEVSNVYFS
ncbi:hypothetical protein [Priestia megaterium]|uniref:hypothetical protein n=1 Tax=Priestia megaterium TaxID=1404 RepID=UPI0023DA5172|nr:hypothetical protein [Priestia megaterium]MDF2010219.1 hypothetical protein [Priestia megaterium]